MSNLYTNIIPTDSIDESKVVDIDVASVDTNDVMDELLESSMLVLNKTPVVSANTNVVMR